jgi:hypothetical protein
VKLNKTETKALYELVKLLTSYGDVEIRELMFTRAACRLLQEYNPINTLEDAVTQHKGSK